jgi:hypothetical protein
MKFIANLFKSILYLFAFKSKARDAWIKSNGNVPEGFALDCKFVPGQDGGRIVTSGYYHCELRKI